MGKVKQESEEDCNDKQERGYLSEKEEWNYQGKSNCTGKEQTFFKNCVGKNKGGEESAETSSKAGQFGYGWKDLYRKV